MGFLSKLMKNPLVQMAVPMGLSWMMPHLGISSLLGGVKNPMLRSAIEQSLLGYGSAKLTGSKHPEKAAMYSGLASMPFSFMKANAAADAFNKAYTGKDPSIYQTARDQLTPAIEAQAAYTSRGPAGMTQYRPAIAGAEATYGPWKLPEGVSIPKPIDAWDVLGGKKYNIPETRSTNKLLEQITGYTLTMNNYSSLLSQIYAVNYNLNAGGQNPNLQDTIQTIPTELPTSNLGTINIFVLSYNSSKQLVGNALAGTSSLKSLDSSLACLVV